MIAAAAHKRHEILPIPALNAISRQPRPPAEHHTAESRGPMKLGVVRQSENQYEEAEQLLGRELTPMERKWLMLADELLSHSQRLRPRPMLRAIGDIRLWRKKAA
jgi:hypothetical protein